MTQDASLGEQALSKAAEVGISTQLDEVEELHVDIRTDPLKLMQGQVDSVAIDGEGMVMQKDLRMEEIHVQTDQVSINPLSAAFGKIELTHPTNATTQVVLTAEDLNRAFNSDYLGSKLHHLQVPINGQPMTVDVRTVNVCLPGEEQLEVRGEIFLHETQENKFVDFTTVPRCSASGDRIELEQVQYNEGEGLSPELTTAILERTQELLDLKNFELQGMSLRLNQLNVQPGKLVLEATARIEQFPA